jgi:drug/metabolite transporter (DMT)-like permease
MSARNWTSLLFLSLLWGGSFFFYKVLVAELPPLTIVLGRVGIAAIALNLGLWATGRRVLWTWTLAKRFALLGLLNNVIPFILICWGETRITSGLASILNATTPIFLVMVAHVLTRDEKLSAAKIAAVVLGFAGVAVLVGPASFAAGQQVGGELAVLAAACTYAFGATYGKRFNGLPPIEIATGQITAAAVMMLPVALVADRPWTLAMPSAAAWASLLAISLVSTALAYVVFYRLIVTAGATNISLVTFLLPINALWLGAAFLGEPITMQAVSGMALIGAGLAVIDGRIMPLSSRRRC